MTRPERIGPGSPDAGMLRIFAGPDNPVGLGFLVTDQLALTCAHVVSAALGLGAGAPPPAGALISVDLPLGSGQSTTATVDRWFPAGDIAVLRLAAPLPGARPVRLVDEHQVWGHPARAYGLPDGRPGGVWHSAVLRDIQANGLVQADLVGSGYRVSRGFSGSPVWDDELAGVVGMIVLAEAGQPPASFLIPTSGLLAAWPDLRELVAPPSPFRGLRPFGETDVAIFHGRQAESDEVARTVAGQRWTTLVGPSGCGKSSLAMAGVVPRRRAAGDCPVVMRPGHPDGPLHALAAALVPLLEPNLSVIQQFARTSEVEAELAGHGLHNVLPRVLELNGAKGLLVVVDQFEELLDVAPSAVDGLARVLFSEQTPAAVRVLCTLRADFLEPALAHPSLGPVVSKQVCALEPMRPEQLREIITRPVAEMPGVRYEPNLAERILADAGTEPSALPLLGFTLDLLWGSQERGVLTHRAYEQIGGVAGALGDYAADAWANNIAAADEPAADRLLTQLVRVPIGATAATRRIAPRAELPDQEWAIAQRLAATRLLVLRGGQGPETVELAHEALIAGWDRLARQIVTDRSFLDWRESLRHDLDRWQRGGRAPDLLPTPTALAVARQWLPERAAELSDVERDYLDRGDAHRRAQARRRRAGFTGLAIVVVAALVLGSLFVYAQQQSNERQAEANSRALAQTAQDDADYDPGLAMMAALEAYQTSPTQEARNQLLREHLEYASTDRVLSGMSGKIAAFHTSSDGNVVLAATDLGRTTLFVHAENGTVRTETVADGVYVDYTQVSPDGRRAAFVGDDGTAGWFEVNPDGAQPAGPMHLLPKETAGLDPSKPYTADAVALSNDGRLLAARTSDRLVWWNLDTGTLAGSVPQPPNTNIGLWISPDDKSLLVQTLGELNSAGSSPTGLVAVDMATGQTRTVVTPAQRQHVLVSGDRTAVAVCQDQDTGFVLRSVRISDGSTVGTPYSSSSSDCNLDAVDTTGRRIVLGGEATPVLVNLDGGNTVTSFGKVSSSINGYASNLISAGGTLLLAGYGDSQIVYSRPHNGPEGDTVLEQALTDSGSKVLTLLKDGSMQLRSVGGDQLLAHAPGPQIPWNPVSSYSRRLQLSRDGVLTAVQEDVNVIAVRETSTMRETTRITTAMPPVGNQAGDLDPDNHFSYFFDWNGNLVTVAGLQVQQWDPRTGRQLAHFDVGALLHAAGDVVSDQPGPVIAAYPAANQISVVYHGDPTVRIVDLSTRHTVATVRTAADATGIDFDPSGHYFALLRQSGIIELWERDPLRKDVGPLHSVGDADQTLWRGAFLDDSGHFMIAANDAVRIYQIGQQTPPDSYEFGHPDGSQAQNPYSFMDITKNGSTVLYTDANGSTTPLALDPAGWQRDLCRTIGNRAFTSEEQASLPAPVRSQPICPAG